ncbi:unnamed protein product [Gongylonema pulchrum]|uniref:C2H2-type domain-containing protein n=1 Tax=Gongylonema pulchrum TaxID=637853 RepID=A0A183EUQ2_9BILA|nr:unnamed protein product [Gongylonema pulchrum]
MSGVLVMDGTDSDEECLRSGALRQGFLCPFCVQDLGDQAVLHAHVRKCHPQSTGAASSDLAFCHLKDIFGKAKQKIMQIDAPFSVGSTTSTAAAAVLPYNVSGDDHPDASKFVTVSPSPSLAFSSQQFGITRNHTDYYLKCRAPCINDAAVRTNTLIIRLDKLINQCPADSNKRKGFCTSRKSIQKHRTCGEGSASSILKSGASKETNVGNATATVH